MNRIEAIRISHRTPEFREKMRVIGIERQKKLWAQNEYRVKQIESLRRSKQTKEFKMNQSAAQKKRFLNPKEVERARKILAGLPRASGEKSGAWKGGVSTENEKQRKSKKFKVWRNLIFTRDNWTCQICKKRGGRLHPHHIKKFAEYPELRFDINNGKTLCVDCHKKQHLKINFED